MLKSNLCLLLHCSKIKEMFNKNHVIWYPSVWGATVCLFDRLQWYFNARTEHKKRTMAISISAKGADEKKSLSLSHFESEKEKE